MAVQKKDALRVACAYRSVSVPAALVIAGFIPIGLPAAERKGIFEAKEQGADMTIVTRERTATIHKR